MHPFAFAAARNLVSERVRLNEHIRPAVPEVDVTQSIEACLFILSQPAELLLVLAQRAVANVYFVVDHTVLVDAGAEPTELVLALADERRGLLRA